MSITQALALIGGGMSAGLAEGEERKRRRQKEDEDRAWTNEQRTRQRVDWKRQDEQYASQQSEEDAVKKASAPTTVDDAPVAVPIGSRDVPRAPEDQGIRAAGQTFTSRPEADAAAAAYNAAPARMRRAAAVISDPVRAGQLDASANQAEAGTMQMNAARQAEADRLWARQSVMAMQEGGPEAFAAFLTKSPADSEGGKVQVQAVYSPDQKKVALHKVNPDGTTTPFSPEFENTEAGRARMVFQFDRMLSPDKKLEHAQRQENFDKEFGLRKTNADREFGLRSDDAQARRAHEARMARAAERSAGAAERAATAKSQPQGLTLADLKDGHKTIASTLNADYKAQLEDPAADPASLAAIKTTREREIADAQRLYTGAMMNGIGLTPEQAIMAFRTGKRTIAEVPDADGKKHRVEVMVVNGRMIPFADAPGKDSPKPAAPAPAPAAAAAPGPAPAAPPRPAPAAPPAAAPVASQQGDGAMARIVQEQRAGLAAAQAAYDKAAAAYAAVARSGDQAAMAPRLQELNRAAAVLKTAQDRMGNAAP